MRKSNQQGTDVSTSWRLRTELTFHTAAEAVSASYPPANKDTSIVSRFVFVSQLPNPNPSQGQRLLIIIHFQCNKS